MAVRKMHVDEVETNEDLVRRMLVAQFPQWADLAITPVPSAGTDNALYRLGEDMTVRLPRITWAVGQVEKEQQWLPKLAPHLPLAIPVPLGMGTPVEGYPWNWSVYRWFDGTTITMDLLADPHKAVVTLAQFIAALQQIDTTDGPPAGPHNFGRGIPLEHRDLSTRDAINSLHGIVDTDAVTDVWEASLQVPAWDRPPVWVHGDLQAGNLLAIDGQLSAVIDFGGLGVGDPAVDLIVAWNLLSSDTRAIFRDALPVDEATWLRGRGWALSIALIALPYYLNTNPHLVSMSRRSIEEILQDYGNGG